MFYDAGRNDHGLRHDPFKAVVVPRPVGWISSVSRDGVLNLAPYSFFNAVSTDPHIVAFASYGRKDSLVNAEEQGEFVCNLATWDQCGGLNMSSATVEPEVDEFALAGLETEPSRMVRPPRVKGAPVYFECVWLQTMPMKGRDGRLSYFLVFGEVVGVHIEDRFIHDGMVDTAAMKPIARLGYHDYSVVDEVFTMKRPG
ncbi:flavin reductase family protein [Parvibaculum sp.]|uniref:flavin reductase family protein n=1 Tax=Parvibaculum sp. TaxID=2024848 RepID=UPI003918D0A1